MINKYFNNTLLFFTLCAISTNNFGMLRTGLRAAPAVTTSSISRAKLLGSRKQKICNLATQLPSNHITPLSNLDRHNVNNEDEKANSVQQLNFNQLMEQLFTKENQLYEVNLTQKIESHLAPLTSPPILELQSGLGLLLIGSYVRSFADCGSGSSGFSGFIGAFLFSVNASLMSIPALALFSVGASSIWARINAVPTARAVLKKLHKDHSENINTLKTIATNGFDKNIIDELIKEEITKQQIVSEHSSLTRKTPSYSDNEIQLIKDEIERLRNKIINLDTEHHQKFIIIKNILDSRKNKSDIDPHRLI